MGQSIAVIGAGYVGLVTGACFAELGHNVVCVDKDADKIELLNSGGVPIYEAGLPELLTRNVAGGRLSFSTDTKASVKGRDAVFICVDTPADTATGAADLGRVLAATAEIAAALDGFTVLATKSTVPVGTNAKVAEVARVHLRDGAAIALAANPEFLREGLAVEDVLNPDRIVVGADDPRALEVMRRIYAPLIERGTPFVTTGIETAELIKYAANGFLALKLSFINEIADLCERVGADVEQVAHGIGLDPRIGANFLKVGPGWGGSCFPKDTQALLVTSRDAQAPVTVMAAAVAANDARKAAMAGRIIAALGGDVSGKTIAVLGLAFKGQTDDMRESPALDIVPALLAAGAKVRAFDPAHPADAARLLPGVELADTAVAAANGADAIAVVAEWKEFRTYDLAALAGAMRDPVMIDLRNLFSGAEVLAAGFRDYFNLGMPASRKGLGADQAAPRP